MAWPQKVEQRGISKNSFFLTLVVVAVIAFALGTRGNDILASVGPVFGFSVPHGQIDLSSVEKTYQQLNASYDGTLNTQKLIDGANSGLVNAAGDQFTVYLSAKDAKTFSNDLTGNVGAGIGAEISMRHNQPTITGVLPGNPAVKAGLKADDAITAVNDTSTKGWSANKVAAAIRGQAGTTVKLTILRDGEQHMYSLTRATINNPSVTSTVQNGIGIMTISRFDDKTGSLAEQAAQTFVQQNVKGVVVDLRDNGGGYVDAAQSVASLWLNNRTVLTEKTHGKLTTTVTSDNDAILGNLPTVLLVNGNTASASEIVSGALRNYGKAQLVGEQTYGKGTMQQIIGLGGGSELKVTIAHWYMPNGKSIEHVGLKPDKIVPLTPDEVNAGQDPQMQSAMQLLGV